MENINKRQENDEIHWTPFLRQVLIASSCWVVYFCIGVEFGSPTVIIPQMRRANITITADMASWLSSAKCYAAIPWVIALSLLCRYYGRKKISIFISLALIVNFTFFYFSTTPVHLLLVEVSFGVIQASVVSITINIVSEFTSPKYRGIFLCIKSASFLWGIWASNAIGTFTSWKYIPLLGLVVSLPSLAVFYWPESPFWLASKYRFAESKESHRWLKGTSQSAEVELEKMIQSTIEFKDEIVLKDLLKKEFLMPLTLSLLAVIQYQFSGKFVITIYCIDILKKIIPDQSTVYTTMLILDGVSVFGAYFGSFLVKFCKRRTLYISTSSVATVSLLTLSLYLYLIKVSVLSESVYVSIFILAVFSLAICCGPLVLSTSLYGELIPSRYKSISYIIIGLEFVLLHGTLIKIGLTFIKRFEFYGALLFYGVCSGACVSLMYFYLPETKDKTLLEIEEYFRNTKHNEEGRSLVIK